MTARDQVESRKNAAAAQAGASPLAEQEPRTQVIEVPDGGTVDPSENVSTPPVT